MKWAFSFRVRMPCLPPSQPLVSTALLTQTKAHKGKAQSSPKKQNPLSSPHQIKKNGTNEKVTLMPNPVFSQCLIPFKSTLIYCRAESFKSQSAMCNAKKSFPKVSILKGKMEKKGKFCSIPSF